MKKTLFKYVIISAGALIMISTVIYSCNKNKTGGAPGSKSNAFFSELKAVTPSAIEASAYEVQLAFKDENGNGAIPTAFKLNMPGEKNYEVSITSKTKGSEGTEVYAGTAKDNLAKGTASKMLNFTLVDDPPNKTVFADFGIDHVSYTLTKKNGNTFRLSALKPIEKNDHDGVPVSLTAKTTATALAVADGEQCDGVYIIDLFIGFSAAAVNFIGEANLTAYANNEVASVNNGLANSLVNNVRLRLVGTGITPNNPGVVTSALADGPNWFAGGLSSTGADLLYVVQEPTDAPGSAGGWGYMPGWVAVGGVGWTTVYRHEVGHNAGSNHCEPGIKPYAAGYNNGHWRTHMCGNDVNYYSNPDVLDDLGNPIGNANTANNARLWRERAAEMSGRVAHTIPFSDCESSENR